MIFDNRDVFSVKMHIRVLVVRCCLPHAYVFELL